VTKETLLICFRLSPFCNYVEDSRSPGGLGHWRGRARQGVLFFLKVTFPGV